MMKAICRLWFKMTGWKVNQPMPEGAERCVLIAAPHTSNYDGWLMVGAFSTVNIPIRFTIKKEWLRFPFKMMMRNIGALPIDRRPKNPGEERPSMVDVMADLFQKHKELTLVVTPEGSRSLRKKWKSGFYWVAQKAGVPIGLSYLDYDKKRGGIGKIIWPTDYEKDMREIMAFYKDKVARFPDQFSVDLNFVD